MLLRGSGLGGAGWQPGGAGYDSLARHNGRRSTGGASFAWLRASPQPSTRRAQRTALAERRDTIARLIDCAFVLPSPGSVEKRLVVCARGQAPDELPPSGAQRSRPLRPFDPADCRGSVRLGTSAAGRWPQAQLCAALEPFLAGRSAWPSRLELQSAVFEYIEAFYNRQRRHSTLNMLSPADYEQLRRPPLRA